MCGIIGQLNHLQKIEINSFDKMRDSLTHRGPDDAGSWYSDEGFIALGHRRLSFLDLSEAGHQPMTNEDGTLWLTFNGEIYNYKELRSALITKGHNFKSTSDSEVLLHGYEEWGISLPEHLKGMFAFGIWDIKRGKLFLVRDRFGIKPLYYAHLKDKFIFASEIKAIHLEPGTKLSVNYSSVIDYLNYRYVPSPATIWKEVAKLPPAYCLVYDYPSNRIEEFREYWKLKPGNEFAEGKDAVCKVDDLLYQSISQHIRSDVPVGSFLSGGYDSSAIVYYLHRLGYAANTFSIGFDGWNKSEHQFAQLVAEKYNMPFYHAIAGEEQFDLVSKLMYFYDEPIADISIIPTYMVSALAARYNKAVLSGEGADEIFCGYWWQKRIASIGMFTGQWWQKHIGTLHRGYAGYLTTEYADAMAMGRFSNNEIKELIHPDLSGYLRDDSDWFYRKFVDQNLSPIKNFQYMDIKTFMGELVLTKIDRSSMANSLEVRVPFLDHELFEYIYALNDKAYFRKDTVKYLLHENIKKSLPDVILKRGKQGFVGPDKYYMKIDRYAGLLINGCLVTQGIIKPESLRLLIKKQDHWRLWKLFVLEIWWRTWVGNK
jgi:asparagine synthase (glutamine-hydrolysing)